MDYSELTCLYCSRSFRSKRGLNVHVGHMHKNDNLHPSASSLNAAGPASVAADSVSVCGLENVATLKNSVRVIRHIPKGARSVAAEKVCEIIHRCLEQNGVTEWCALLSFAYSALRAPECTSPGSLTTKVKNNIAANTLPHPTNSLAFSQTSLTKSIESKVHEGDLRSAVRILVSDDTFATQSPETLVSLQSKHPAPSRPLSFPPAPTRDTPPLTVQLDDVARALGSFHNSSSAGLDGIRPSHLKELTSPSAGDNGFKLLQLLTKLSNFLLSGQLNPIVCPFLYGATLCALGKKDGGVRPIAVGSVFRRLVAKLGCGAVKDEMGAYLRPHQLGFGTQLGCEAAIHATRSFVMNPQNSECVFVKLDIRNAFNSLERDVLLREVREKIPSLYAFIHQMYSSPSSLYYGDTLIPSQVAAQQGDPLGPLIFSLTIQNILFNLKSPLNIWYLDDGTLGGKLDIVENDLRILIPRLKELGLEINTTKCECFPCGTQTQSDLSPLDSLIPGFKLLDSSFFFLLGSPIFPEGVPAAFAEKKRVLDLAQERLSLLSAHIALLLLRLCFATPRITYLLRTVPTWLFPSEVSSFDGTVKHILETILNVSLDDEQWIQATLPIRYGGLGVRRAGDVGLPAFLASAHGVSGLVTSILSLKGDEGCVPFAAGAVQDWLAKNPGAELPQDRDVQRAWDDIGAKSALKRLIETSSGADMARLRAVTQKESGAWLHALPSPHFGTLLDGDSLRVAVALRLGCKVCEPHLCICGSMVDSSGHHALGCTRCAGRFPRHHALNEVIRRAMVSANVPCRLEPPGLIRTDGRRPDGLTLVPWQKGRCLLWDATCVSTFAASHLCHTVRSPGAAAESAARKKHAKYQDLARTYEFVPFAVETSGSWGMEAIAFISALSRKLREKSGDPRAGSFLVQRLAIAIQRGNAASVMGTFAPGTTRPEA